MPSRERQLLAAVIAIALAAVIAIVVLATGGGTPTNKPKVPRAQFVSIPVKDAKLAAEVISPKSTANAPLLVIPGSWGDKSVSTSELLGARFAQAGYQVVTYAQRGWGGSTGKADFAGTKTQQDASQVITWALKHTHADPKRVGMLGLSYGAGMSLLTAAHDKRVRAVVALSTWTDVTGAFVQNNTPNVLSLKWLLVGPNRNGHFDATVSKLQHTLLNSPKDLETQLRSIASVRSPDTYLADLNRNRPAIMLANSFEDSILSPSPLIGFFDRLTTPKRLEFARGDHGAPELNAVYYAAPSPTLDDAQAWLDHYLRGVANGADQQPPILLRDIDTDTAHTFAKWPTHAVPIQLGAPGGSPTERDWQGTVHEGTNSAADYGPSQFVDSQQYKVPTVDESALTGSSALVWNTPTATGETHINGTPTVHLQLGSSSGPLTIYAYLYDVGTDGTGSLIDMAPYSGTAGGGTTSVTFGMQPTSWTEPAGHHLALVIDGADARYQSLASDGTTITVASSSVDPAVITIPVSD